VSKNLLAGLFVLLAAGIATWLFLPLATAPVETGALPPPVIVPIGPIQVDLMLIVLLIAAGVPAAGLAMGLLVRWLSGKVPAGASTPAAPVRKPKAVASQAATAEMAAETDLPFVQKVGLWFLILITLGLMLVLIGQVLPPGFTLF
jgi:hypothetical protein